MIRFGSKRIWLRLTGASVGMVVAVIVARSLTDWNSVVGGNLTTSDVQEIRRVVGQRNFERSQGTRHNWLPITIQGWAGNRLFPIRSIHVTTNNLNEFNKRFQADLALRAATNPSSEVFLKDFENHMRSRPSSPTNQAVEVWYLDKQARWGEAGYTVEKRSNVWAISVTLFR